MNKLVLNHVFIGPLDLLYKLYIIIIIIIIILSAPCATAH